MSRRRLLDVQPTGPARRICLPAGHTRSLGAIQTVRPVQRVRLFVGLTTGTTSKQNRTLCKNARHAIHPDRPAHEFLLARKRQAIVQACATITPALGIWKDERGNASKTPKTVREPTSVIEVIYGPSAAEPTFEYFKKNLLAAAQTLSRRLCQDSILAVVDDGRRAVQYQVNPWPARASRRAG